MLNPSQRKAVEHFGKPLLIVAGAGSGKTNTLTHKVAHLIGHHRISPDRILLLTFTNKAGREMSQRVKRLVGKELPHAGTFHSFCLGVLRQDYRLVGYRACPTVLDEEDKNRALKNLFRSRGLSLELLDKFKAYMSSRQEGLNLPTHELFEELLQEYTSALREGSYVDFSGMLTHALEIFRTKPIWRERFDFILVDEFQDTNTVQYEILKALAGQNICVVGDPNQCIYEWRHAKPDNILRFREDFNPDIIRLEENYRSSKAIISLANAILENSKAPWKELVPVLRTSREEGEKPVVMRFEDEEREAQWIASKVRELSSQYALRDMALLVRVGYITNAIERAFNHARIPYVLVGQVRFFDRAEVKDVLSFLRLVVNPRDEFAFERAIKCARAGVGSESLKVIKSLGSEDLLTASIYAIKNNLLRSGPARGLYHFLQKLQNLIRGKGEYPQSLEVFLEEVGFWDYLADEYEKDYEERVQNVKELLRYLRQRQQEGYSLEDVLSEVFLSSEDREDRDGVRVMTMHAGKGLEFSVVFLPRLEDGILPHEKALEEDNLEEELRLFYVAVTRAKERLFMSYTKSGQRKPSRFLSWIPKSLLDLSAFKVQRTSYMPELKKAQIIRIGDRVRHILFGEGVVLDVFGDKARVRFNGAEKTIYASFLEVIR